ncbi:FMN-binding negative transcriptional regulator [Phenylobacterium aquaticum]|uniref:FMN-binding negative transcriptional regulator n=1 Tax=Phenylobacterium aquaticum TaxID=1763816 RepID=UPI0026F198F3|nr:FMN-binding negative transcriptional regulator [Phenylobacterium aquaticum]
MYTPAAFRLDDLAEICALVRAAPLATLVTATADGLMATPLPLILDETEGPHGVLHGHLARANPQASAQALGEALAIFTGADAYITPAWYAAKAESGQVVPTWNYEAVHAHGPIELYDDPDRLRAVVTRLTDRHEAGRPQPWAVTDAPAAYIDAQLRAIIGVRIPITRLEAKRKLSQNRPAGDRQRVGDGLGQSERAADRAVARAMGQET